mgnify:CR=1 FL=1
MITSNSGFGKGYNPADDLPKLGRKTLAMEQEVSFNFWWLTCLNLDNAESGRRNERKREIERLTERAEIFRDNQ